MSNKMEEIVERIQSELDLYFKGNKVIDEYFDELKAELSKQSEVLRCEVSGNPCGTDTHQKDLPCLCENCKKYQAEAVKELLKQSEADKICGCPHGFDCGYCKDGVCIVKSYNIT